MSDTNTEQTEQEVTKEEIQPQETADEPQEKAEEKPAQETVKNVSKLLTQEEVDAIVAKRTEKARRLQHEAEEKATKYESEANEIKTKAEFEALKNKVATSKGVPADLLVGEDEESLTKYADSLLNFASDKARNGVIPGDTGAVKQVAASPKQEFAEWWNDNLG